MLEALRKGAGGIVAKIFIGILALSFAVWGISDVFTGRSSNALATVGDEKIFEQQYQVAFQRRLRGLSQQFGRQLSLDQARALGVDRQVLNNLVSQAALDDRINALGLTLSDKWIAGSIVNNPLFHDSQGKFDRNRFERLLASNGFSEGTFLSLERRSKLRAHLAGAVDSDVNVPETMSRAIYRQLNETRQATYFVLPPAAVRQDKVPEDADISTFYNANKARFTAPEYRSLTLLKLEPKDLAGNITIRSEELRKAYAEREPEFSKPEKRTIEKITFATREAAEAARKRLSEGTDFLALASELKQTKIDVALGDLSKKDVPDPKLADAAFGLKLNEISQPVVGSLSITLVRVTKITPGEKQTFEQVKDKLKKDIALERAQEVVLNQHDTVEDERAGGATLKEIAEKLNLPLIRINAIDAVGKGPDGKPVKLLPNANTLLASAFRTDVGVENDPADTQAEGFVWFDVTKITPQTIRPLSEVREKVVGMWKKEKLRELLVAKARSIVEALKGSSDMSAQAQALGQTVLLTKPLKRQETDGQFGPQAVAGLFLSPKDDIAQAPAKSGGIVIFKVGSVTAPNYIAGAKDVAQIKQRLTNALGEDLAQQFLSGIQAKVGVQINQAVWRRLIGQAS